MKAQVVLLPRDLKPEHLHDRAVVVLDVLRATTSMITALNAGVSEIRIFDSLDTARAAACGFANGKVLCGEERCKRPPDFGLGNSPADFTRDNVAGRTLFMSTTNGTRAIVAAQSAPLILVGALVNARAVAQALAQQTRDVAFVCSGTEGQFSIEDALGAGAMLSRLSALTNVETCETAQCCLDDFEKSKSSLPQVLRTGRGARNILAAGLEPDIDFAARLDMFDIVGEVRKSADGQISVFRRRKSV
jgi:2-phosphosulfolactate phosphatase